MSKNRVLIIGASGNVGDLVTPFWKSALAPVLLQHRSRVPTAHPDQLIAWDPVAGPAALLEWISENEPPACMIVLAGVTPRSGRDLTLNTQIVETCLEACRRLSIPRALVASSSAVYGDYLDRPFSEDDAPRPINAYGEAKLAMEQVCVRLSSPDLQVTCLRIGNVAGADALLAQALQLEGADIAIDRYADGGTPLRSYIGPITLAETLIHLADYPSPLPSVLNVGSPAPVEMGALADAAGMAWHPKMATNPQSQKITLDCARLWRVVPEPSNASEPAEMVMQLNLPRTKQ